MVVTKSFSASGTTDAKQMDFGGFAFEENQATAKQQDQATVKNDQEVYFMLLKGKVAIVTGGTRGIGNAIVRKFLENGAAVVLFGSRKETVEKAVKALKETNPEWSAEGMFPDLSDPQAVADAISAVKETYGKVDILVNNAGIAQSTSLYDYQPGEFDKIMDLNVKALFYTIQPAAKIMKEQGGGCILNTSSMVSISGQPSGVGYPASKFAVNGLTLSLARELAKDNIRVNAVAPGVTRTDMVAALPDEMVKAVCAGIPLGRMAEPEDIANAFLFLASDMASYVTGEVLSVDGAARA
ncbi:Bile acid 7-dehydroxylase 1/3 [uncultured Roseburia sp.]|nr:Bile acid 7-dehydroxylase 1/3 [uncultured Roseburia sp.]